MAADIARPPGVLRCRNGAAAERVSTAASKSRVGTAKPCNSTTSGATVISVN